MPELADSPGRPRADLDEIDRRLINALQGDFPLVAEPYRQVAEALGLDEAEVLRRLDALLERRVLTRFGPMFQIERAGGAFVLAAMRVPEAEFERVAEQVNAFAEVAHNYRREHNLNMWFVLATATPQGIGEAIAAIEARTGLPVFAFPKEREYFVEMKLRA
jgi:DNA-binding Lrp family transcriptional regulator